MAGTLQALAGDAHALAAVGISIDSRCLNVSGIGTVRIWLLSNLPGMTAKLVWDRLDNCIHDGVATRAGLWHV
jgi:hypothetical protein